MLDGGIQQSDNFSYKSFDIQDSGWKTVKECKNSKGVFKSDSLVNVN